MRTTENVTSRPITTEVSEGRLRNVEVIAAIERAASSSAASASSEARQRLQEGTKVKPTEAVKIPSSRSGGPPPMTGSVPIPQTNKKFGLISGDISSSLSRTSNVSPVKVNATKTTNASTFKSSKNLKPEYDETKNPFADDEESSSNSKLESSNPFGDDDDDDLNYKESLNPFAE